MGASACLASEMVLISIVTGHNLAKTHTKDDIPNPTENGVSTLAFLLSIKEMSRMVDPTFGVRVEDTDLDVEDGNEGLP